MGANALRVLLNDKNFTSIDETVEKVQDTLKDQKQVEDAITLGNQEVMDTYLPSMSEQELEQELNSLETTNQQTAVHLPKPIETESELLRLQNVLSSLNHPAKSKKKVLA